MFEAVVIALYTLSNVDIFQIRIKIIFIAYCFDSAVVLLAFYHLLIYNNIYVYRVYEIGFNHC
jgi:hypothetical protein